MAGQHAVALRRTTQACSISGGSGAGRLFSLARRSVGSSSRGRRTCVREVRALDAAMPFDSESKERERVERGKAVQARP